MTHQNREAYLQKTLRKNLEDCKDQRTFTEFILMDFNSNSKVREWVMSEFEDYLQDGYLKYFHSDKLQTWHASVAKNASHSVAEGAILVNLDCDNFAGPNGSQFILDTFLNQPYNIVLWQFSGKKKDGSFGRISLTRDVFYQLGGYDESFLPMGYQDDDLLARAQKAGLVKHRSKDRRYNSCISNEKYKPDDMSYAEMKKRNKHLSKMHLRQHQIMANGGLPRLSDIKVLDLNAGLISFEYDNPV